MTTNEEKPMLLKKKSLKLEDQLREAMADLDDANKALAAAEAKIADRLAPLRRREEEINRAGEVAEKLLAIEKKAAERRLGITQKKMADAVLAWAGVRPDEERLLLMGVPRLERGLSRAVNHFIEDLVASDAAVIQATARANRFAAESHSLYDRISVLERTTYDARLRVDRAANTVGAIREKISAAKRRKPAVSAEDAKRYVEARRRIKAAEDCVDAKLRNGLSSTPPFVWPPPKAKSQKKANKK